MSAKFPRGGGEQTHSQPSVYLEMSPKNSPVLWWPQINIHNFIIHVPQKSIHFSENLKDIEIKNFEPKQCPSLYMILESEGPRVRVSPASLRCGPWTRQIYPSLVLVQHRKTRPYITERLLMGRKESNQTKSNKSNIRVLTWDVQSTIFHSWQVISWFDQALSAFSKEDNTVLRRTVRDKIESNH